MGKLAFKILKSFYGIDIEAQNSELVRLRLENKRLSELLRSTSREYNSLNEQFKKAKEKISEYTSEYENCLKEIEALRNANEGFASELEAMKSEFERLNGSIENSKNNEAEKDKEIPIAGETVEESTTGNDIETDIVEETEKDSETVHEEEVEEPELKEDEKKDEEEEKETETVQENEVEKPELKEEEEKDEEEEKETGTVHEEEVEKTEIKEEEEVTEEIEEISDDEETRKYNMQKQIVSLTKEFDYVRVTISTGSQYIYQSKYLQLKAGLFDWGIEGKEIITDELLFISNEHVKFMEGLKSPFTTEEIICDMTDPDKASEMAEILLMAICTYQPVQISYHDKNGRTTMKNLYHITFTPLERGKISLPYRNVFKDMLEEKIDTEHITALCPHNADPRNFAIAQIMTIRVFDAFFTTINGIENMREAISLAQEAEQPELADILKNKIPQ